MSKADSRTIGDSIGETKEYHERYLRAVSNPLRREILRAIRDGCTAFDDLLTRTKLDASSLNWHLNMLENGFCVNKEVTDDKLSYRLTQEGKVVDFLE